MDNIDRIIELDQQRKELEAQLDTVKSERAQLEAEICEQWAESGTTSLKREGVTVHLWSQWRANPKRDVPRDAICDALVAEGAGALVQKTYNANSLSAFVRNDLERTPDGTPKLPPALEAVIETRNIVQVRTRKS